MNLILYVLSRTKSLVWLQTPTTIVDCNMDVETYGTVEVPHM